MKLYEFSVKDIDGSEVDLGSYKGKVILIVNVASACGFTPQYEGLQDLFERYKDKGLEILAFPCNQFGSQEPGSNEQIKTFCEDKYSVSFKLFDISVKSSISPYCNNIVFIGWHKQILSIIS